MTKEDAEKYIKSEMCKNCSVYLGGGKCSDNCKVIESIKALEQESILDKIRSEIEQIPSELTVDGQRMIRQESVFQIIDKYITKSEDKE